MHPAYANNHVYYLLITQKDQIWSHDLESKISVEILKHAKVTVYASIEDWFVCLTSHLMPPSVVVRTLGFQTADFP